MKNSPLTDIKFKPIPLAARAAEYPTIFTVSCTAPKGDTSNNSSKNERACAKKSLLAVLLGARGTERGRIRGKSLQGDPRVSHLAWWSWTLIECNPGRTRWLPLIQGSRRGTKTSMPTTEGLVGNCAATRRSRERRTNFSRPSFRPTISRATRLSVSRTNNTRDSTFSSFPGLGYDREINVHSCSNSFNRSDAHLVWIFFRRNRDETSSKRQTATHVESTDANLSSPFELHFPNIFV